MSDPLPQQEFSRILLVKPTALGDVVHTVPVLVELRRRYPRAQIDWLVTPENAELVQAHPALSGVLLFDRRAFKGNRWAALRKTSALFRELRRRRYELVVDLHGQLRTALFTLATGAPWRVGFDRPVRRAEISTPEGQRPALRHGWAGARELSWLAYNRRLRIRSLQVHAIERYLWLREELGLPAGPVDGRLYLPAAAEERAAALQKRAALQPGAYAVIAPGTMWETKHWRVEGFAEIARRLAASGQRVVLVGTAKDGALSRRILQDCPEALDLTGQTSPAELAVLLRQTSVCVTNDSGAMHLTVAMGSPVVAIFGPTDPVMVGPYGQAQHVVRAGLPCSPCHLRKLSQCPYGLACMLDVTADLVWAKVQPLLDATPAGEQSAPQA